MSHFRFHRRDLLRAGLGGTVAGALSSGLSWGLPSGLPSGPGRGPRNLVLLQLSGGNDGLSMVVPHGDDALRRARRTLVPATADLHPLDDHCGLHPALKGLAGRWAKGQLAVIEGVGYPKPDRSHFKSLEIWHTADTRGRNSGEGWIGKLAAAAWEQEDTPELIVHMGREAPYSLYSRRFPPIALESPTSYRWFGSASSEDAYTMAGEGLCAEATDGGIGEGNGDQRDPRHAGRDAALARLRATLDDANQSSRAVREACAVYRPGVEYPRDALAASLRDVAALIHAGLGTRTLSVTMGGFDTHANQRARHDRLMRSLDTSVTAFLDDLERSAAGRESVVVIFSEFGRRLQENGSRGSDHGKAGPMFVVGPAVRGGFFGGRPSLTDLDGGDLRHTTDFRSVYGTLIERWFGVNHEAVLGAPYPALGFLG